MNDLEIISPTQERKQDLRPLARAARRAAANEIGFIAGDLLAVQFSRALQIKNGAVVAGYWPKAPEIDVLPLMTQLQKRGHVICLPVPQTQASPMQFRRWLVGSATVPGPFGVPVPLGSAPLVQPDIVLLPLLAFDRRGARLGQGGGYYDMTLDYLRAEKDMLAIGVGFAAQEFTNLPVDIWDQPLDWVVTENEAIKIGPYKIVP